MYGRIRQGAVTVMYLLIGLVAAGCASPSGHSASKPAKRKPLTIAAVSIESKPRDTAFNLGRIEAWAPKAKAAGADLVLFPELALSSAWQSREIRKFAEPIDGPAVQRLIRLAGELDLILVVGMTELDGDKAYITQVLVSGKGIIGRHRKSSLAGGPNGEGKVWDTGQDANVFDIHGRKVGIAICFESVHPETCAALKANGAEIILAPYANGTDPKELITGKRPYTYARARENAAWYIACDATPRDDKGNLTPGAAYAIDPQGTLVRLSPTDQPGEAMIVLTIGETSP